MKIKAVVKWCNEEVLVEPVFFSWHVGLQYTVLTGYKAASLFTESQEDLYFPIRSKIVLIPVKFWYWVKMWLWMQIRYWQPNRIKRLFKRNTRVREGELPF